MMPPTTENMKINFTKMHGLGNDFIVIDCRSKDIKSMTKVMKKLSDRKFGIGFDQALILKKSKKADFRMDIYNYDGGRVEMCGNGIRCLAKYIWDRKLSKKKVLEIETLAGIIKPEQAGKLVKVDMGEPITEGKLIPTTKKGDVTNHSLKAGDKTFKITAVSMGNPHAVIIVKDVDKFPVEKYGPLIENHKFFPKRTNVEFAQIISKNKIKLRVWERGTGETLACGTGACGTQVAANILGLTGKTAKIRVRGGGDLKIELTKDGRVMMTGPAEEVFTGTIVI